MKGLSSIFIAAFRAIQRAGPMSWVWSTVLAALLTSSGLIWIQSHQNRLIAHFTMEQTLLRQARVDLAKGYLHVSLGGTPKSPFDRGQGLALLNQIVSSLERALLLQREFAGGLLTWQTDEAYRTQLTTSARGVEQFRGLLVSNRGEAERDATRETELKIAFFTLERQADAVDSQIQHDLHLIIHRFDLFRTMISWGSAVLLAIICAGVYASGRARKRAEAARRDAEIRFRLLFEHSPDGILVIDPTTADILEFNETAHRQLGYSREEFAALDITDIEVAETPEGTSAHLATVMREGRGDFETQHRTRQGEIRDIHVTAQFTEMLGRSVYHCVWRDVTERKRGEEALKESESRFKLLSKTAGRLLEVDDPLRVVNELAAEVMAKLDCQAFFNHAVDDQTGKLRLNAYAGITAEEAQDIAWLEHGVAACGCVARDEAPVVVKVVDSSPDPMTELIRVHGIQAYACHPLIAGGKVIGTLSFGTKTRTSFSSRDLELMRTITDQVAIAAERTRFVKVLRESEDRFRALFEQSAVGVAQVETPTGRFVTVNDRYCDIVGYSRVEMLSRSFQELTHPDDLPAILDNVARLCRDEIREFSMEKRYFHKNGTLVWVNLNVSPLWQPGEKPTFHVATVEDITKRKWAEQEKERLEAQLRQAQKLEAIGTLAGGIAHDFNNILAAILGYAELAQDYAPEGASQRQDLEQVLNAAHRAKELVSYILSFSRQGPAQELRPTAIGPIIEEALKLLRATLPSTVQIRREISDVPGQIMGDPTQLHQVIMNLCTNAAHAMREEGGEIEVTLTATEVDAQSARTYEDLEEGAYLKLTVKDTGHGMDSATLERIFDPYYTTKEVGEGTGLGLAVVHGIVKRHGGKITVQSEPGKGTTFEILFPGIGIDAKTTSPAQREVPKGTERILFVDDECTLAGLGQKILSRLGYQVISTTSSVEALEHFRAHPEAFDLVITDYTMPQMTGAALATEIQQIRRDIPIILCTGYSEMIDERKAKEMGIRAYVMKPIDRRNIAQVIRKALDED